MGIFKNLGHAFAWLYQHITSTAKTVAADAVKVESAINSPIGEFLATLGGTVGVQVKTDGDAVLGAIIASASAVGVAIVAKGLNIQDDEVAVQALERLVSTVSGLFGKKIPVSTPSPMSPSN